MEGILNAFGTFFQIAPVIAMFVGVAAGILGGSLPGISPSMTVALLLPFTLYQPPATALALMLGAYQGAMFGGSISAILINTPGTASAAATLLDGYPMNLKGETRKALQMALYASCTGGTVGVIVLVLAAQKLAEVALMFGAPEYFGLMCMSLCLIAGISGKSLLKGLISCGIGLFVSMIGLDSIYGTPRFTFGTNQLHDGVDTLAVFIGAFAISELMFQLGDGKEKLNAVPDTFNLKRGNGLTLKEYGSQWFNYIRSGIIGSLIGILPGVGGSTASFISYAAAQKQSKHPEKFGTGIIDGVAAAESSNNAVCGGALVPLLTLGIPGDVVTAVLLGGLVAQGILPGPLLFQNSMDKVYLIFIGLGISVLVLAIIGTLGVPVFAKIISVRKSLLLPCVFLICFIGTYAARGSYFTCYMMLIFGLVGFLLRKGGFPIPPMIIAFVLGSSLEANFRRSLLFSADLGWKIFFTRPLTLAFLIAAVVIAFFMIRSNRKLNKKMKEEEAK